MVNDEITYSSKVGIGFRVSPFGRWLSVRLGLSLPVQVRLQVKVGLSPVRRCRQPLALTRRIRKVQKLQVRPNVEPCKTSSTSTHTLCTSQDAIALFCTNRKYLPKCRGG